MADQEEQSEEVRKMFVGGITAETTTEELTEYFAKYGEVDNSVILKKKHPRLCKMMNQWKF